MSEANEAMTTIEQETTRGVGANRQELTETLSEIQANEDLSDSAKSRLIEEARTKASERHTQILSEYEAATKEVLESNEKRLFRLSYPESVTAPAEIQRFKESYRDAAFKVLDLAEDSLSRVMTRAVRVGDTALEQAAAHEAIERGLFSVANEYRERHPDATEVWRTYEQTRLSEEAHGASLTRALLSTAKPGT
jgi:hypothetical protein